MVNLTKQVALDYAKDRIHCNALCPGCKLLLKRFFGPAFLFHERRDLDIHIYLLRKVLSFRFHLTPFTVTKTAMTKVNYENEAVSAHMVATTPWGGWGNVADVAKGAVFLASDDAAWVTGVSLPVDGGYLAQ